jgi:hypothetical protein
VKPAAEAGRTVVFRHEAIIMCANATARWEGGKIQMKTSWVLPIAIFLAVVGLMVDAPAQGQSASCFVYAGMENTHIMVRELDMDGNPENQIYSGWINQGQKVPIYSRSGKIDVNYRQASSDQTIGRDDVDCTGGRVISVP